MCRCFVSLFNLFQSWPLSVSGEGDVSIWGTPGQNCFNGRGFDGLGGWGMGEVGGGSMGCMGKKMARDERIQKQPAEEPDVLVPEFREFVGTD